MCERERGAGERERERERGGEREREEGVKGHRPWSLTAVNSYD